MNKCIICGTEFEVKLVDSLGRKLKRRKYCSQYCAYKSWKDKNPEKIKAYSLKTQLEQSDKKKEDIRYMICVICKNKVYAKDVINFNSRKTCGRMNCEMEYRRQHNIEYQRKIREVSTFSKRMCKWCNSYFYPKLENQLFCSNSCNVAKNKKEEYYKLCEELREQKRKYWIIERTGHCIICRKEFFSKFKKTIFCEDCRQNKNDKVLTMYSVRFKSNFNCQVCGIKLPPKVLDTHHIKHKKDGGGDEISNRISICPNCHALHHRLKYSIDELTRIYSFQNIFHSI